MTVRAAKALGWTLKPVNAGNKTFPGLYSAGEHRVTIGSIDARMKFLAATPDNFFGEHGPPVDGSITYPFFRNRILQIDYPHHVVRISDLIGAPDGAISSATGTLQLVGFGHKGPPIVVGSPFTVNGKPVRAQIDTCCTGTMLVYDDAIEKLGLAKRRTAQLFPYTDGGVNMLAGSTRSVGFGNRVIAKDAMVYFVGAGRNPVHQPDGLFQATVGNALFAHSVVTMDFHAMTLEVKPAS